MTKRLMLGVAIGALALSGAFAQSSTTPDASGAMKPPAAAPANPSASIPAPTPEKSSAAPGSQAKTDGQAANAGTPKIVASQSPDQFLASSFNGTDVIGSDGKTIGKVADILFEKDGTIKAYVISFGGFLGMGANHVAIAPSAFEVMPADKNGSKKLKLSMSQNDLQSAQKFTAYQSSSQATTTGSGGGTAGEGSSGGTAPSGR